MERAGQRCQCTGQCGARHKDGGGRCEHQHSNRPAYRLLAAPAEPAALLLPVHQVAALPASRLIAWCLACRDRAQCRAASAARTSATEQGTPDGLFDL
ncbi:hypothetical protein [Phaeacidiphilus oryzae]|uniref:hypothetical protein n=1 Tax=Phaeacidiphilus oryzae TaxID=348818 RepID=UPI00126994FD|nr:hypothetical protein [Phaeacidiphilus oryzae]